MAKQPGNLMQNNENEQTRVRPHSPDADENTLIPQRPRPAASTGSPSTPQTGHSEEQTNSTLSGKKTSAPLADEAIGKIIKNRFVLTERLGEGGMGSVYKARDILQEQAQEKNPWVAIKLLDMVELNNQDALMWLQRETSKARSLAHPNVIRVYDIDRDDDQVYMTMEFLEGISLESWIEQHSPATVQACEPIWHAIVAAVDFSHQKGIVHCDLKPGNVLISNAGEIKVIDFGIARGHTEGRQDATVFNPGDWGAFTPGYASCELIAGLSPEPRDDIYSMAVIMYKMLTGRKPFGNNDAMKAKTLGLQPHPIKGIHPALWEQIKKGLSFERKSRPESMALLLPDYRRKKLSTRSLVIIAIVGLSSVLAYYTVIPDLRDNLSPTPPQNTSEPVPQKALSPEVAEEVAIILDIAQAHYEMEFYIRPTGANAREAYMRALSLDPTNRQALEGLNNIAEHFLRDANQYIEQRDYERASVAIAEGLKTVPDHKELLRLQQSLSTM